MLIAALAAGDLTGSERERAIALTRSCAECATLHDDLLALARATAAAPPPIAIRPRDFTLTPADAARLRPAGWRRLVGAVSSWRSVASRPLGVGLATLGLVGLLVGNISLSFGSAASAPAVTTGAAGAAGAAPASSTERSRMAGDSVGGTYKDVTTGGPPATQYPAPVAQPAASGYENLGAAIASGAPTGIHTVPPPQTAPGDNAATPPAAAGDVSSTRDAVTDGLFRPLNLLFGAAIVLGIGIIAVSRLGRRPPI